MMGLCAYYYDDDDDDGDDDVTVRYTPEAGLLLFPYRSYVDLGKRVY